MSSADEEPRRDDPPCESSDAVEDPRSEEAGDELIEEVATDAGRKRTQIVLLLAVFLIAVCGLVYELLAGTLSYPGIARLVETAVERFSVSHAPELDELEAIDAEVRAWAQDAPEGALA